MISWRHTSPQHLRGSHPAPTCGEAGVLHTVALAGLAARAEAGCIIPDRYSRVNAISPRLAGLCGSQPSTNSPWSISKIALFIQACLWQNNSMPRWLTIMLALGLGIGLGLVYGWFINPVQFTEITPEALRIDYRTDYVLMVAEAYQAEQDEEAAARRLAILGSQSPGLLANEAYTYADQANYTEEDLVVLQELVLALQAWQPIPGTTLP